MAVLALLMLSLPLTQAPAPATPPPAASQASSNLQGDWVVNVIDNIQVMPDSRVTISFQGARVSGLASCNSYTATFTTDREHGLKITGLLTTMKACDEARMSQERDFKDLLPAVVRYEIAADDTLVLTTAQGETLTATRKPQR